MTKTIVLLAALTLAASASAAKLPDPRICSFSSASRKDCASMAAVNLLKRTLHTDGQIACAPRIASLLRYRCALKNTWQTGTVVIAWAPLTFKPAVTVLSLVCQSNTVTGAPLPQTGCTKTIPFQPST